MGLLRLAVLGPPEAVHDGSHLIFPLRKAQALLLYLAVEKGMHSRSKLAALLWPDSEPHIARKALRNALALLRRLLAEPDASLAQHTHLLGEHELLGLDPQAPLELDLDVVQHAYQYALKAIAQRERHAVTLIVWDFYPQYETEVLLRGGDASHARAEMHRQEGLGPYPRFRIPYLRSLAALAAWEGHGEQTIDHLREAAQLASDLGLPGEQWQIQVALGRVYEASGLPVQARTAFEEAARIIRRLAERIKNETLRTRFLAGSQIQQVLQHAQSEASAVSKDQP